MSGVGEMNDRPQLSADTDAEVFMSFYYLKEELMRFCRENGLSAAGSKAQLTERIAYFLKTGRELKNNTRHTAKPVMAEKITDDTLIEENIVCSQKHRTFFEEKIGKGFSFNVQFQKWLKANAGKNYSEAVDAYHHIIKDKKKQKTTIDSQFEYNTYIRDFFDDNKGRSLQDAIKCWKYKKSLKGHNRYERSDLTALEDKA